MKYVSSLSSEIESMLHEAVSGCPHQRVRQRAQAILWSAMGYSRRDIADLSFVVPIVVSHWLDHWEKAGLSGLYDAPRSGRPPIYTAIDGVHLKAFLDELDNMNKTLSRMVTIYSLSKAETAAEDRVANAQKEETEDFS